MSKPRAAKPSGRPRKDRVPPKSTPPTLVKGVPRAPQWLSKPAKAEWRRAAAQLAERRVLTAGDLAALETFCSAKGRLVMAESLLAKDGMTVKGPNGMLTKHPAITIINEASSIIKTVGVQLGLTPLSRRRAATEDARDAGDRWEGLVDG